MKRLESSVHAFRRTLERITGFIKKTVEEIERFDPHQTVEIREPEEEDFDMDDVNTELFSVGRKVKIDLADMDYVTWKEDMLQDYHILTRLLEGVSVITPVKDLKLTVFLDTLKEKINNPINSGNKKILVFSAFADTVKYLYDHAAPLLKTEFGLDSAMITGGFGSKCTIPKLKTDLNTLLTCFSPLSKDKRLIMPDQSADITLLVATDCISEGQNLQDCDYLINYDIHWNPVRIIQRFGRIDRIGSRNEVIQLVNFWPDMDLDEYIKLKSKVETRMKATVLTATGDDNPIDEEKGDLEYRQQQLERLQKEVVDIEEMSSGVSIMDLGLNEFRMDLLAYIKEHPDMDRAPFGMHAIVASQGEDAPPGVIFILKNLNNGVDVKNQNRLHPFYMVYISEEGKVFSNHLESKKTLDILRYLCGGKSEPMTDLCRRFNEETEDGRKMKKYSDLLQDTIASIIQVNEEKEVDSLFKAGGTTALQTTFKGLDDFELIDFVVVM